MIYAVASMAFLLIGCQLQIFLLLHLAHWYLGIFAEGVSLGDQLKGIVVVAIFAFVVSYVTIFAINKVFQFRASDEEQMEGIDVTECGLEAYPEFKRAF